MRRHHTRLSKRGPSRLLHRSRPLRFPPHATSPRLLRFPPHAMSPHYNFSRPFPHDVGAHQRCRLCIHPGQPLRPCAACLRVLARFVPLLASRPHLLHHLTACSSGSPSSAPTHCGEESVGVRPLQTNASASRYSRSELRLRPRLRLRLHLRLWHARPHRSLRPQPHLRLACSPAPAPLNRPRCSVLALSLRLLQPRLPDSPSPGSGSLGPAARC